MLSPIDIFNKAWHKGIQEFLQSLPASTSPKKILSSEVYVSEIYYAIRYIHPMTDSHDFDSMMHASSVEVSPRTSDAMHKSTVPISMEFSPIITSY